MSIRSTGLCATLAPACALALGLTLGAAGTADSPPTLPGAEPPNDRLHVHVELDVRVTTAVPSAKETKEIFGFNLYKRKIQPVWLQIENLGQQRRVFLPAGLDPAYLTPFRAAHRYHTRDSTKNASIDRMFYERSMGLHIEPGSLRSGYVFTHLDEGTKSFNVDVYGESGSVSMTFFVPVPGLRIDHREIDWDTLYPQETVTDLDLTGLVRMLEEIPCCTTNKKAKRDGDPLNIVVIGDGEDVYHAFVGAGWDETETVYRKSLIKTVRSFLGGGEYRYSPVSALFVFGRGQDVALQKARQTIHERNHLRLWLTRYRHESKPVWIGQISRDIGVHFTKKTITTHKIDPDVDETREYLVEDLAYAQSLVRYGYVCGVGAASMDAPRGNLTGDPYFTDGRRVVLWVSSSPVDLAEIERLDLQPASD